MSISPLRGKAKQGVEKGNKSMQKAGPENNWHYNKKLRPLAKALRHHMTKAEACLWKYCLRAGKMMGYSFTRQRPVLSYIVDFMCKELCLVIEVDGVTRLDEEVIVKDQKKDKDLTEAGFTVLRFCDEQVLNRIDLVAEEIEDKIKGIIHSQSPPPFIPPPAGDI